MPERQDGRGEAVAAAPSMWSGTITFGLVNVPVNLLPAIRSRHLSLRMVSPQGTPLARRYFTRRDGRRLEWEDIVRGYEVEKDRFVVLDDDELDRLAPERTRDIDLRLFVNVSRIDPMLFERPYYLAPAGESTKAYRLLAAVMEETGRAGIATFVMRAKEYLVAILAQNGILRAETLRFAEEIRTPEAVGLPAPGRPDPDQVARLEREIADLAEDRLDPTELAEESGERLRKLVARKKRAGRDVVRPAGRDHGDARVTDLVAVLRRSLEGDGQAGPAGPSGSDGAGGLGERSKAELYRQAQELDIGGRSRMTKAELIDAIRRAP